MNNEGAAAAMGLGCCLVAGLLGLGLYLFTSYVLYRIGRKFEEGSFIEYCIPIYNVYLLTRCAQITPLWLLALLLPIVNLVFTVYLWGTLAARLGKEFWLWGLICTFFSIPILILAFDRSEPVANPVLPFE